MTIMNEAVRLFFAISALILVGMLSAPMGLDTVIHSELSRSVASVNKTHSKTKQDFKIVGGKMNRKFIAKKG